MKRFNIFSGILLIVSAFAITACGGATTAVPAPTTAPLAATNPAPIAEETTLRVGFHGLGQSPDPVKVGWQSVRTGLAETLFKLDTNLDPVPWLATGIVPLDETTWEITIRQGVKFHNGALMDAAAVKASLERTINENAGSKTLLDIARIEEKDSFTIVVVTNGPNPALPGILTHPTMSIVDAAAAEAMGDAFNERPVLTGPYKVDKFQLADKLEVVRNEDYWGAPPLVDRVIYTHLPDINSRVLGLQSGDLDIALNIPPESVVTIMDDPSLTVVRAGLTNLEMLYLNQKREPWKDLKVRQAISMAIDREALVTLTRQGEGAAAVGPFPPVMLSCPQLQPHPFDPAKAEELLGQAGYQDKDDDGYVRKEGQTLTMELLARSSGRLSAETIQASLKTIGIKVDVRIVEHVPTTVRQQTDWDAAIEASNMAATGDPYLRLYQEFSADGRSNFGGYSSPVIENLIREVGQTKDRQERQKLACQASQAILDELPQRALQYTNFIYGVSKDVVGFNEPHPLFLYIIDGQVGKR